MKKVKKIIVCCTLIAICLASLLSFKITDLYAMEQNNLFSFSNSLYDEYKELEEIMTFAMNSDIDILSYDSKEIEGIKSLEEIDTFGQISIDNNGKYIYAEINNTNNSILMELDNQKYLFVMQGENIYMIEESGKKL